MSGCITFPLQILLALCQNLYENTLQCHGLYCLYCMVQWEEHVECIEKYIWHSKRPHPERNREQSFVAALQLPPGSKRMLVSLPCILVSWCADCRLHCVCKRDTCPIPHCLPLSDKPCFYLNFFKMKWFASF